MKRTQLLLGILLLLSLLFGCQEDGASNSAGGGDDESAATTEAASGEAESDNETDSAANGADEAPDTPRATATAIPFSRGAEETAAFPSDVAGKQADDIGNLTVALTTPTNATPLAEAEVFIFSEGLLVYEGKTSSSIFRQTLPLGSYDIAVRYGSTPPIGYLQKDIEVASTAAEVVEFVVPDEGKLLVNVLTQSGAIPGLEYEVQVLVDDREVSKARVRARDEGSTTLNLRSDVSYTIIVAYGDQQLIQEDVQIRAEEDSINLVLPFDENTVELLFRQGGEPLADNATITILDSKGTAVVQNEAVTDSLAVLLRLGEEYTLYVDHGDALTQIETISVTDTGLVQLVIVVND